MTQERILRGNRARQILDDPLVVEAFQGIEKGAIERLAACDLNDHKRMQTLTMSLQSVRAFRHLFQIWIADGEDAARKVMQEQHEPGLLDRVTSRFRR